MTLTKVWLQGEIDSEPNPAIKLALERIKEKWLESPDKTSKVLKEFDADETYARVAKYYIDKQGYTPDQAHEVAKAVVLREKERRGLA